MPGLKLLPASWKIHRMLLCDTHVSLASLISQLVLLLFHSASLVYTCMHVVAV